MDPATTPEVKCNGPCQRRFRSGDVNGQHFSSHAKTFGLMWFCSECNQLFNLQQTAKCYGTNLPAELWIEIFEHLDSDSLLRVCSTCHCWKDIVDLHQSLRMKLEINFDIDSFIDEGFKYENLLLVPRVAFYESEIVSVDGWWPPFGAGLTELKLFGCEIALRVLLRMLKETPNLTKLFLGGLKYTSVDEAVADFRLEKLEFFWCIRVFEIFVDIFPRLKILAIGFDLNDEEEKTACRLLRSVQKTLKDLECNFTEFLLEQIASMKWLQLTTVMHDGSDHPAVQISRLQRSIEDLTISYSTNEALLEIGQNLTKLKEITVTMEDEGTLVPSFLAKMSQLKHLTLYGLKKHHLNFGDFKSAKLVNLELNSFRIAGDSLRSFLSNSPNLQVLELSHCKLDSWSDIFAARLESLRFLKLNKIKVVQSVMNVPKKLEKLKELRVSSCNIAPDMIVELLLQCPGLENLTFGAMDTINDEFINILGLFPQLKKLHI